MTRLLTAGTLAAALAVVVGCNKTEQGGTPGTDSTFRLSGPATSTTVKQGETVNVNVGISRDSAFNKAVGLKVVDPPKGLKADFKNANAAAGDKEVPLSITADKDAPTGDQVVKVTGTPEGGGKAVTLDVKVTVKSPTGN